MNIAIIPAPAIGLFIFRVVSQVCLFVLDLGKLAVDAFTRFRGEMSHNY